MPHESLAITAHDLLRMVTALLFEVRGVPHKHDSVTAELNQLTGRHWTARDWLAILEPSYRRRFMPGDTRPLA
jgi:hypothetical protein